ncbi:E3 ubiquitin-protein ligase MARCHF3-like isoform X1 [Neodiprion fabricii]|uniref:E3 ubiquitin-protein ligase MARCHF3-like isoform X1 n=1 Tax=Neodiprion fabricii TaxID=2872261 RepID=UPI001ED8EB6B|nr:E3 ubiquitin-protein ligase MARCHF3-like isoform X1 [Neodiprion fabricii]
MEVCGSKTDCSDVFEETTSVVFSSPLSCGSYKRTMSSDKQNTTSTYCRICHEGDDGLEELVDPCKCSGSVGLVHASCLEKWLSTSNTDRCEICKYVFTIEKKKKPISESACQWWRSKSINGPRGIGGDAVCFAVLTPLCFIATYLCAIGASAYSRLGYWEGTGLAILCSLLVMTYCLWLAITIRYHYKIWRRWRRQNQDVVLLVKHKINSPDRNNIAQSALGQKSPRHRQDRNNDRGMPERPMPRFIFNVPFNHNDDPMFTLHQQTSLV